MAIMYFQVTPISRGKGRSAVAAAAYRSGERIRDERTGKLHNFSRRDDIPHKEIVLPSGLNTERVPWVKDRAQLWNAAEAVERQRNSRVAREFQLGLPHELSAEQRLDLARSFSRELSDRYRVAVDLAVHLPRAGSDPRNHHAHLMLTSREITPLGFGGKAGLDLQPGQMQQKGLREGIAELKYLRERWATMANEALRGASIDERVDHRTLAAQGVDRFPRARVPWSVVMRERKGLQSDIGDRVRANHLARVQAKKQRGLNGRQGLKSDQPSDSRSPRGLTPHRGEPPRPDLTSQKPTLDELQRQSREAWMKMRREQPSSQVDKGAGPERPDPPSPKTPGRDDDHSL